MSLAKRCRHCAACRGQARTGVTFIVLEEDQTVNRTRWLRVGEEAPAMTLDAVNREGIRAT